MISSPMPRIARLLLAPLLWTAMNAFAAEPATKTAQPAKSAKGQGDLKPMREIDPLDWPSWRGPEQNGISRETGLIDSWDPDGGKESNILWQKDEAGGISTPIVMRGKLYTIVRDKPDTKREREKVLCLDAATGKQLWENAFNVFLSDVPAERVGWSCCVGDPTTGRVYAQGVCGFFQCLDGETGKTVWSRSLSEEFGLVTTYGGRTNVPVVFEDLALISGVTTGWGDLAVPAHRFLAFNKVTGELVWQNGTKLRPEDTTYSTPFLTVLGGQAALVFGSGDGGVWALQPRTGRPIWNFQLSRRGLNVSPVVAYDKVYIGQAEENIANVTLGAIVAIDGTKTGDVTETGELWRAPGTVGKSSPLVFDGRAYFIDDTAKMYVLDAQTGDPICPPVKLVGNSMRSSPLYADGKIYACTIEGWQVFQPTEQGVKVVTKMRLPENWDVSGSPIVSHGRIYLPTGARLYCLGQPDQKPSAASLPDAPTETPAGKDDKPAQVQVVPAEVLLKPGEKQGFVVRLFNERGQLLKTGAATFELKGPGEIDKIGSYTAAGGAAHSATILTAKVGDLSGQARIRVVPPLPWKFDFKDGDVPITWVGARYRHIIRDIDGNKVLVKVTTIPKGTRSQAWMGQTAFHDYTVQADVHGARTNGKLPDAGVIAQRYTLDLMGASQQLQIRSWTAQVRTRFSKSAPYEWDDKKWYTLKFRAAVEGGKAVLKGKVWPRDEKEPKEWTIEAVDEVPNVIGSPGLFGNSTDAEIWIDNVSVTENKAG